jgi:outer membrane protein assembly factor BamA
LPATEVEKAEGLPIAQIEINGNRRVSREDALAYLTLKVGGHFSAALLASNVSPSTSRVLTEA